MVKQVDALFGDVLTQDGEVVAVKQGVLRDWLWGHRVLLEEDFT